MAGINRVEANGEVLLDLTKDTVTPASLRSGFTAHDRNGDPITGEGGGIAEVDDTAGIGDTDKVWSADKSAREDDLRAPKDSPTFTGTPTAPTASNSTNNTQIATTAFVKNVLSDDKDSPTFTGTPKAPTASNSTNNTQIATTAFVKNVLSDDKDSPTFTGTPTAPTADISTDTTQIATTAFVHDILEDTIDDESNDIDKVWSADKSSKEINNKSDSIISGAYGYVVDFDDGSNDIPVKDLRINIIPRQYNNGNPISPSNPWTITPWTDVEICKNTGKNLYYVNNMHKDRGISWTQNNDGSISFSGTATSTYSSFDDVKFFHLPAGTYTFSINEPLEDVTLCLRYYLKSRSTYSVAYIRPGTTSGTFTINEPMERYRIYLASMEAGNEYSGTFFIQFETGSEATSWEPYNGSIQLISLENIDPVYGGTYDVTTGRLLVRNLPLIVDGVNNTVKLASGSNSNGTIVVYVTTPSVFDLYSDLICDKMVQVYDKGKTSININEFFLSTNSLGNVTYIYFLIPSNVEIENVDEANEWLSENPYTFVHPIAEPIEYSLPPVEFSTYLGNNHIFTKNGNIGLDYVADTKLYIDQKIAESQKATRNLLAGIETDHVATKNYISGDLLIIGNTLYKVTANISNGSSIVVDSNIIATTVAEQLILLAQA